MNQVNLSDIAEWIRSDQISLGYAVSTYHLSKEEKGKLKEMLKDNHSEKELLQTLLLDDIEKNPTAYYAEKMSVLFSGNTEEETSEGNSIYSQFVNKGYTLNLSDLQKRLNLPSAVNKTVICGEEFSLPEYSIKEYEDDIVNQHRTDVFFLGAANSGKSSMACCVIKELVTRDEIAFEPFSENEDRTKEFYEAAIACTRSFYKTTASSSADNLLFCQFKDDGRKRLTIIDGGRRGLADLAKLQNVKGSEISQQGIYRLLSNDNSKMLFFLLDFNVILDNNSRTLFMQVMTLERAIQALMYDGAGKNSTKGCTMSKVKTLGLLFTKYDKSSLSKSSVSEKIQTFMDENLQNLLRTLDDVCKKYNINNDNENKPYIMPFSLGKFTVGNTLLYNLEDAKKLTDLIISTCPKQLWWHC